MSKEVMVVAIIAIIFGYLAMKQWSFRNRNSSKLKQRIDMLETEIAMLRQFANKEQAENIEQRLQTLEKIVTDDGYELKRDINSL
ncbi:hypothetical protein ACFSJ3_06050 [Corallincola platygyrae]|uniref:Uncharacterized protein n=1 Tax=Corallincola platygyrae TaxID=1193278 RepID=A0ABW4XM70_9GAMM